MAEVHEGTRAGNGSGGEQARDKAQELAGQAQEKVQEAAGEARNRVAEQVDQRSTQAGEQLGSTAGDVRSVAEELRKQGKDKPAEARREGGRARRARSAATCSAPTATASSATSRTSARRRPWAVVAGGLALGFVASRFLKASSGRRYEPRRRPTARTRPTTGRRTPASAGHG